VTRIDFSFVGSNRVPEPELRRVMRSQPDEPFIEADAAADRAALRTFYRNLGFLNAAVEIVPQFSNDDQDITLTVTVAEEQQVVIGEITVVGNERVSTAAILDELNLIVGQPLGEAALANARVRLTDMGVFRRASVTVEDAGPGDSDARIVVSVVESPATSIGFGGGLEGETRNVQRDDDTIGSAFELSPRGFFEIGRRNLGGRNRAVNLFSRANLRPRSDTDFFEYRVTGTYREQRAFRTDTTLLVGVTSEQAHRTSFNFIRRAVNGEVLRRISPRVSVSGRYGLDFTQLFDETFGDADKPDIDRLFPQVRLSTLSTGVTWDRRDNPLVPTRGTFATADVEIAARAIGSEVGYVKTVFQLSLFRSIGDTNRTVLALRGQAGLARGFERLVPEIADGEPVLDENGNPILRVIRDLPISKRFFSGGSTTVRGFPVDRLGVPIEAPLDPVGVLNPNGLSIGGSAVVILNAELRRIVGRVFNRNLAVVGFLDGGNVFADTAAVDLSRLRTTYGFGVRYDSPLGPIRFDLGIKTERLVIGTQRESGWEYHLSIGEAF
jgi:outer membrane protein insertion porin family